MNSVGVWVEMDGGSAYIGDPQRTKVFLCPGWGPVRVGAHMGPYGLIYGPIWALMGPYGPMWALMGPPGQVLEDCINFP